MEHQKIHQIAIRLLKENHCLNRIKKHSTFSIKQKTKKTNEEAYTSMISLPCLLEAKDYDVFDFFASTPQGKKCITQYQKLLLVYMLPLIQKFIHDNSLEALINKNLSRLKTSHKSKNIEEYLQYLYYNKGTVTSFFLRIFSWIETEEGFHFWTKINHQYYLFMKKNFIKEFI